MLIDLPGSVLRGSVKFVSLVSWLVRLLLRTDRSVKSVCLQALYTGLYVIPENTVDKQNTFSF